MRNTPRTLATGTWETFCAAKLKDTFNRELFSRAFISFYKRAPCFQLSTLLLGWISVTRGEIIFKYLAVYNNEYLPNGIKNLPK